MGRGRTDKRRYGATWISSRISHGPDGVPCVNHDSIDGSSSSGVVGASGDAGGGSSGYGGGPAPAVAATWAADFSRSSSGSNGK
jgi:hypothetical protein